jgi:hypothetical protein
MHQLHLVHGFQIRPITSLVVHSAHCLRTGSAVAHGGLSVIVHLYQLGGVANGTLVPLLNAGTIRPLEAVPQDG